MGRPPIGKTAMTGAERTRRYRAQLRNTKPVTKPRGPSPGQREAEYAEELFRLGSDFLAAKDRNDTLVKELAQAKARIAELETNKGIDPATFSMTAQQKMDAWKRQQMRAMERAFEQRVIEEVRRRIDEIVLPHWKQKIEQAKTLYDRRKALMDKATFNRIRRGLHPDSRHSITDKTLAEAFDAFMGLEKYLLNEKDSPTEFQHLPESWAEWEKAKQQATAARKAKRAASRSAVRPH